METDFWIVLLVLRFSAVAPPFRLHWGGPRPPHPWSTTANKPGVLHLCTACDWMLHHISWGLVNGQERNYFFSHVFLKHLIFNKLYFLERFWVHSKFEQKVESSHIPLPPTCTISPTMDIPQHSGYILFVTIDEPTLTHHCYSKVCSLH